MRRIMPQHHVGKTHPKRDGIAIGEPPPLLSALTLVGGTLVYTHVDQQTYQWLVKSP